MKKQELKPKHIAPYGDKKVKCLNIVSGGINTIGGIDFIKDQVWLIEEKQWVILKNIKLILHPLSDLTKPIQHNGKRFIPLEKSERTLNKHHWLNNSHSNCALQSYWFMQILFAWHFDVNGLIKEGLAIDINK